MKWTEERKTFIRSLFHNNRLIFKNIGEDCLIINHEKDNLNNYDFMIMAIESCNCYLICIANLHSSNQSSSFKAVRDYLNSRNITAVAKYISFNSKRTSMYEKVFIVPFSKIEEFAEHSYDYFNSFKSINEINFMVYGYYDETSNTIMSL